MERQFRINWQAIIEEAKQRRKRERLTQSRLAKMAGVSTPTISRFENGAKDIQLSTALSILAVLGMHDARTLNFPEPNVRYVSTNGLVKFTGEDGKKIIECAISEEALEDHFFQENKNLLQLFHANQEFIEHQARRKYLDGNIESDGSILLKTNDIS